MDKLRFLNFDDLYLMRFLLKGYSLTNIARELKLTQPAVTQRVRKIESVFGQPLFGRAGRDISLTREGHAICKKASDVLSLMGEIAHGTNDQVINIGTRPEAGRSWLWPAIAELREKFPQFTYHMSFGSGDEILAQLGINKLDAVLTSAPVTTKSFRSIELVKENYVLVAAPKVAATIKKIEDLENHVLVEHDRSFPFMRYVSPQIKTQLRYRDVWFLESTEIMASALAQGLGVGIIPAYIAERYFKKGELKPIKVDLKLGTDNFRLVYRAERDLDEPLVQLSKKLVQVGLR